MINLSSVTSLKEIADQIGAANAELSVLHAENDRLAKALNHNLATLAEKERQAKIQDEANKWQAKRIGMLDALFNEKAAALGEMATANHGLREAWKTVHDDYIKTKGLLEAAQRELNRLEFTRMASGDCRTTASELKTQKDRAEQWKAIAEDREAKLEELEEKAKAFAQENNRLRAEIQTIISAVKTAIHWQEE